MSIDASTPSSTSDGISSDTPTPSSTSDGISSGTPTPSSTSDGISSDTPTLSSTSDGMSIDAPIPSSTSDGTSSGAPVPSSTSDGISSATPSPSSTSDSISSDAPSRVVNSPVVTSSFSVIASVSSPSPSIVNSNNPSSTPLPTTDCPQRVVPLSWDRDHDLWENDTVHILSFGGSNGLRIQGTSDCEPVIGQWKNGIPLHQHCEIGEMLRLEEEQWATVDHVGFYFSRDRTGDRASITFFKVSLY